MKYLLGGILGILILILNAYALYVLFMSVLFGFWLVTLAAIAFFVAEAVAVYRL